MVRQQDRKPDAPAILYRTELPFDHDDGADRVRGSPRGGCDVVRRLTALFAETFAGRGARGTERVPVATMVRERINLAAKLREAETVVQRRLNGALRRRLSDRVTAVFHEACLNGDISTAEELLAVLEAMHRRRQIAAGDRRISDEDLVRAREDLATRQAERVAAEPAKAI